MWTPSASAAAPMACSDCVDTARNAGESIEISSGRLPMPIRSTSIRSSGTCEQSTNCWIGDGVDPLTQGGQADRQLLQHESRRAHARRAEPRAPRDARLADPFVHSSEPSVGRCAYDVTVMTLLPVSRSATMSSVLASKP